MSGHVCPSWIGYILLNPLRKIFENPDTLLGPFIEKDMVVVEPGCGMGYFTLALARMVGPKGRVIAVDLQEKMLSSLSRRAQKTGLSDRIDIRLGTSRGMGLEDFSGEVDVVVAIHMVHEVPNQELFFKEIFQILKKNGKLLIIEPKGHVSLEKFRASLSTAGEIGFLPDPSSIKMTGRKSLLYKP
jgi:ubiquinone/menaquinone biosynthesis C-methylase UbiE